MFKTFFEYVREQATAEASMQILFAASFNLYIGSMEESMNKVETYLKFNELITLHHKAKTESLAQVWHFSKHCSCILRIEPRILILNSIFFPNSLIQNRNLAVIHLYLAFGKKLKIRSKRNLNRLMQQMKRNTKILW